MIMNVEYSKIKKAVPILLFLFVFSLVIDNSFKLISVAIADDLNISVTTVSWQATLAGLVIGIGAVVSLHYLMPLVYAHYLFMA